MRKYIKILSAILILSICCLYAQEPKDSVSLKSSTDHSVSVKKKKKKLTKEEKKRIKDLDAVVTTAKYKYTKEEKARINRLTILEQDLQNWLKDEQAEWYDIGPVELYSSDLRGSQIQQVDPVDPNMPKGDNLRGTLYVKRGATLQARISFEGVSYDCERHITYFMGYLFKWRFKDMTLTTWLFDMPCGFDNEYTPHPEYKHYNPWQYLIDLDKKNGIIPLKVEEK